MSGTVDPARLAVRCPDGSIPTYARERRQLLRAWRSDPSVARVTLRGVAVEPAQVDWSKLVKDSGSSGARGDGKTKVVSLSLRPAELARLDAYVKAEGLALRTAAVARWIATLATLDAGGNDDGEEHGS